LLHCQLDGRKPLLPSLTMRLSRFRFRCESPKHVVEIARGDYADIAPSLPAHTRTLTNLSRFSWPRPHLDNRSMASTSTLMA
jgi:hypothetical protein